MGNPSGRRDMSFPDTARREVVIELATVARRDGRERRAPRLPLAQPRAARAVRRGDRRRRRARARDRLLPREGARHHRRRRARARLARPAATSRRNTTIIRSNYLWDESAAIYEHSLKLWEGLAEELDYDLLFSQRGVLNLAHNLQRRARGRAARRRQPAQRHRRRVARRPSEVERALPDRRRRRPTSRYPVLGATYQPRGGIAQARPRRVGLRARAPTRSASTSIQDCEVTGHRASTAAAPSASRRRAGRSRAGRSRSSPPATASRARGDGRARGCRSRATRCRRSCPSCSSRCSTRVVMSNAVHVYVSQAHKGELVMGAGHRRLQLATASAARST